MKVSREVTPKTMRFPDEIKEFFVNEAAENGRSFNSEIMQALKEVMNARIEKQKRKEAE